MLEPKDRERLDRAHQEKSSELREVILWICALVVVIFLSKHVTEMWQAALCYLGLALTTLLIIASAIKLIAELRLIHELNLTDQDNDEYFDADLREYIEKEKGG